MHDAIRQQVIFAPHSFAHVKGRSRLIMRSPTRSRSSVVMPKPVTPLTICAKASFSSMPKPRSPVKRHSTSELPAAAPPVALHRWS